MRKGFGSGTELVDKDGAWLDASSPWPLSSEAEERGIVCVRASYPG
jgi:hypothetical protein